jgi:predicted RNA-binding protein associated with RNAse of E/G family
MNIRDMEQSLDSFAKAGIFSKDQIEVLKTARDVVAALRASKDLPNETNIKDLVEIVWENQTKASLIKVEHEGIPLSRQVSTAKYLPSNR